MTLSNLTIYIGIMLALAVVPGPSMILAFTEGALIGVAKTIPTASGNMTAAIIQAAIALVLIKTAASISIETQIVIQLIGALFIGYLGWSILISAPVKKIEIDTGYHCRSNTMRFVYGFSISAFNPKSILFFASLFPQLVDVGSGYTTLDYLSFFLPIVLVGFGVFLAFSFVGRVAQGTFGDSRIFQRLPAFMGGFLILFSVFALVNTYSLVAAL